MKYTKYTVWAKFTALLKVKANCTCIETGALKLQLHKHTHYED